VRAIIESLMAWVSVLTIADLTDRSILRNIFVGLQWRRSAPVYAFVDPLLVSAIARITLRSSQSWLRHLFRLRQLRLESALLLWSTVVIWTFMATIAAFSKTAALTFHRPSSSITVLVHDVSLFKAPFGLSRACSRRRAAAAWRSPAPSNMSGIGSPTIKTCL
jgi:hypothetical protein